MEINRYAPLKRADGHLITPFIRLKRSTNDKIPGLAMTDRSWGIADMEKRNRLALPNTYGAYAKMHQCLVKNETHKFYPMPGNHCNMTWDIMANNLELISKQIIAISSPEAYYCILPRYTPGEKGAQDKAWLPAELELQSNVKTDVQQNTIHSIRI